MKLLLTVIHRKFIESLECEWETAHTSISKDPSIPAHSDRLRDPRRGYAVSGVGGLLV